MSQTQPETRSRVQQPHLFCYISFLSKQNSACPLFLFGEFSFTTSFGASAHRSRVTVSLSPAADLQGHRPGRPGAVRRSLAADLGLCGSDWLGLGVRVNPNHPKDLLMTMLRVKSYLVLSSTLHLPPAAENSSQTKEPLQAHIHTAIDEGIPHTDTPAAKIGFLLLQKILVITYIALLIRD